MIINTEVLKNKCYEMSNSQLPLYTFFNDIRDNTDKNFNKEWAYKDLEKIVDYIIGLEEYRKNNEYKGKEKENGKTRNCVKSRDIRL